MNLSEIKASLNVETLSLNTVKTSTGEETQWMKHWDNELRVAIQPNFLSYLKVSAYKRFVHLKNESLVPCLTGLRLPLERAITTSRICFLQFRTVCVIINGDKKRNSRHKIQMKLCK